MHSFTRGAIVALGLLALAGCAPAPTPDDGLIHIVASTNVYGDIARTIGGDLVQVTSIIDDPAQDPHSYEANVRVQLALSRADIVIENGGGYDDWADTLLNGANNPGAVVLNATQISGYDTSGEFNEHLWYDIPTVAKVVEELSTRLAAIEPGDTKVFDANATAFVGELAGFQRREAALKQQFGGTGVAITEPVPGYLLEASGLRNVTPPEFSQAIEEGTDVAPLVLAQTLELLADHTAKLLVYNAQTTGPQTERVLAAAKKAGVPVVPVTETLPADTDYLAWMSANLDAVESALKAAQQ